MYINLSNKNVMEMRDVRPGQVVKYCDRFCIVTTATEKEAIVCVDLETGAINHLYTDSAVILYSNANLNLE